FRPRRVNRLVLGQARGDQRPQGIVRRRGGGRPLLGSVRVGLLRHLRRLVLRLDGQTDGRLLLGAHAFFVRVLPLGSNLGRWVLGGLIGQTLRLGDLLHLALLGGVLAHHLVLPLTLLLDRL